MASSPTTSPHAKRSQVIYYVEIVDIEGSSSYRNEFSNKAAALRWVRMLLTTENLSPNEEIRTGIIQPGEAI